MPQAIQVWDHAEGALIGTYHVTRGRLVKFGHFSHPAIGWWVDILVNRGWISMNTRPETRIQIALLRLIAGRTSFVIVYPLSTIRDTGHLLAIKDGQIIGLSRGVAGPGGFIPPPVYEPVQGTRNRR